MTSTTTQSVDSPSTESAKPKKSGGPFPFLLWTGAFGLLGLGLALPFANQLSWTFVKVGRTLETFGIQPGILFLAGAMFFALALVVHAIRSTARQTTEATEHMAFMTDELMTQMALVRSGQNAGQSMQEELRQGLARVGAEVAGNQGAQSDNSSDAIFRLAASVDQLNARMDDRIESLVARLESAVESVQAAPPAPSMPEMVADPLPKVAPTAAPAVGHTPFEEPEAVEIADDMNPFASSVDIEQQPAMEFLDLMEEETEGRPHKESDIALDMGGAEDLGLPLDLDSVEGLDDITFPDDDFGSRKSA